MSKEKSPYLVENRLADVLALIQVLAFDKYARRSIQQLVVELQGNPRSAQSWSNIAEDHPEFFRFNKEKQGSEGDEGNTISLISRHVKEPNTEGLYNPLSVDLTKQLFQTSILLHDKQKERADRWKVWLPIAAIVIMGLLNIVVTLLNNNNKQKEEKVWIHPDRCRLQ